ncbi:MAG TPA: class I adenylate-forming enzyme family protein [Acidimicrobiia bacterium]
MTTTPSIAEVHAELTAPGQPFEMDEVVVRGVPTRVWKHAPPSLRAVLEISRAHGGADFLVYEDERWTYERHFRAVARLAGVLRDELGVEKGDRVAIAMRNFPEWSVAFWAATAAGAIAVPLNAWWTGAELAYGLRDSGSVVLFCDAERLDRLVDELAGIEALRTVVVARDERAELPAGARHFDDALGAVPDDAELPPVDLDPEDDATIFYTSGTTGFPKGVLGTHRNICTNLMSLGFGAARAARRATPADRPAGEPGPSPRNVHLLSVPFFHATGCHSVLVANLAAGNTIVLMHKWDPGRALELIEREGVTNFGGVPAMVWQVIEHRDFDRRDLSSLRGVGYGGAPAAPELVRKIEELFPGRHPTNGYGLTETSSVTTLNTGLDYQTHPDSVGVPVPVCDVIVVGPDGGELPTGGVGELWIKGPNVVKGYFGKPEATAESFSDGWLHSGDLGRIDEDGFVYLVDRAKDLLIRGGENISSVEVEAALFEHDAVTDAAVIGIPHPVLGEEVGAVVHTAPGASVTEGELRDHVAGRLAAFKVPARIWFSDEPLPRNPAGKILKRELKTQLLGN